MMARIGVRMMAFILATGFGGMVGLCLAASQAWPAVVAVDVGHAPMRPGAVSARGRPEFEFNRDLARAIRAALEGRGLEVRLINELGDIGELSARPAAAAGADIFLSVHHDSAQPHYMESWDVDGKPQHYSDRFSGFSLFVSRDNPHLAKSLVCASAIGAALRSAGRAPSLYHAEPIPGENRPFADAENGVHYFDKLVVLRMATTPAVLFEAGVIVNRNDELRLATIEHRETTAAAIADGLARCLAAR
jgi:N-acetylmuramoyl-L-alanine amidase